MCTVFAGAVDGSSKKEQFFLKDIKNDVLPYGLTREAVEKEIHVVYADGKVYKGAEGILSILEEYPRLRFLAKVGRLPGIRKILPFVYRFVAKNRYFLFGPASRVYWTKTIVALGMLVGVLLSFPLWVGGGRAFPLVPVIAGLSIPPMPFGWLLFSAAALSLFVSIFVSKPKWYLFSSCILFSLLVFLDQTRLQPWVYQYLSMLLVAGLFSWKRDDKEGRDAVLSTCRLMVASIFFWGGVQKISPQFLYGIFPWMIKPIVDVLPGFMGTLVAPLGFLVPSLEMGIGISLVSKGYRNIGIGFAACMCFFILWSIGPFGHDWNVIVWPWNIAMLLFVVILFAKTPNISFKEIVWVSHSWLHKGVLLFFVFLPALYFVNIWDSYPSWSLYSGTINYGTVYVSNDVRTRLPEKYLPYIQTDPKNRNFFDLFLWAMDELHVPAYPETRVFTGITREICKYSTEPSDVVLVTSGRFSWFNRDGKSTFACSDL